MSSDKVSGGRVREMMTPRRITALVLTVLALVFIFENTHRVRIRVIVPEVTMPLWLALLITFVAGGLITLLLRWSGRRRRQRATR